MTTSIPIKLVEGWITDLQSILKQDSEEAAAQTDFWMNKGMRHGITQIQSRITTWCRHQEKLQRLNRLGRNFLMVRRVNLSDGRYRKLEWYQNDLFVVLAWRHGRNDERGELMLEIQEVRDLSKTYLVYTGNWSFDELAALARKGGLDAVMNKGNRQEWVEQVWR